MIDLEALAMTPEQVMALPRGEREDRIHALMREAFNLVDEGVSRHIVADLKRTAGVVILFSGGNDSTVLAHLFRNRATHAAHANTGVGVEQTREFVRKVCKAWDLPLLERKAPRKEDSYWHMVLERGFPGPGQHFKMFQRLKERALRVVRNEILAGRRDARVVFLAGRRRTESGRRANVPEFERQGSIVWISPLVNWTKPDLSMYRRMMGDVPRNEVSDLIHMSGECLCGAFSHAGERGEVAAFFPLAFDQITELEERLKDRTDLPEHVKTWGWGGDKASLAASRAWAKRPKSGKLCGTCVTRAEAHGQI